MSDSISKWYEMQDNLGEGRPYKPFTQKFVSEGHKKEAYNILVNYSTEAILEAARIVKDGE